jgi:hypothetical protein
MMNGTGDRTIGTANCPRCDRNMRRTGAKAAEQAVLVQFTCPACPDMNVTCAMSTEHDQPIRLDWYFCGIEAWQPPVMSPAERAERERERLNLNQ